KSGVPASRRHVAGELVGQTAAQLVHDEAPSILAVFEREFRLVLVVILKEPKAGVADIVPNAHGACLAKETQYFIFSVRIGLYLGKDQRSCTQWFAHQYSSIFSWPVVCLRDYHTWPQQHVCDKSHTDRRLLYRISDRWAIDAPWVSCHALRRRVSGLAIGSLPEPSNSRFSTRRRSLRIIRGRLRVLDRKHIFRIKFPGQSRPRRPGAGARRGR